MRFLAIARSTARIVLALLTVVVLALVPIRSGWTGHLLGVQDVEAACNAFTIFEDSGSGGSDGNDSWSNCTDRTNLSNNSNGLFLGCNDAFPPPNNNWNDCVSKISWSFTGTTEACLWTNAGYTGEGLRVLPGTANTIDLGAPWNDGVSSIEIANSNCGAPGPQFADGPTRKITKTVGNP